MKYKVLVRKEGAPDKIQIIEAGSHFSVYEQIQKDGGAVVGINEIKNKFTLPAWCTIPIGAIIKRSEIVHITKNLSAMLSAGLPLARALSVLERQASSKKLKVIMSDLSDSISRGSTFSQALGVHNGAFPELVIAMVRAGEESSSLASALEISGTQIERSDELNNRIKGAMIYPSIIILTIITITVLMLIYVVPTLTHTFISLKVQIPLATRIIIAVSNFFINNIAAVVGSLVALIIACVYFIRSKTGTSFLIKIALVIPVIGELVRETYTARAARTLSSLLSAGVPVLTALSITRAVVSAKIFANVIKEAETRVQKGEPLSVSFAEHATVYPILMSEMLLVGEETGKVAPMLKNVAELYEKDVAGKSDDLSAIIEPLLILFIGIFVGFFAISMIAPIYSLSSAF